ncbi:DNA topoisomerase III (EC [Olavius algarvensis Delta 1 endosymbiont]|nr:DNA topoisomerase III (EC [Olavius algarvensis Delta 1 endosymbiont]
MKTLILTEKPSVAMDFARGLGIRGKQDGYIENDRYIITWAVGHLVELYEPQDYNPALKKWSFDNLPIIPKSYKYKPIKRTEKQLNIIRRLLAEKNIDRIVVATDAGREGEVIARTVLLTARPVKMMETYRFWTSQALTPGVVKSGMDALRPAAEYDRLWDAGRARQIADWLVGMNGSRAATIRLKDLFSIGRVQTAVLALLAARRAERDNFKPEPYWLVRATFKGEKGIWQGLWTHSGKNRITSRQDACNIIDAIANRRGVVTSSKRTKKSQPPPLLYSLTDLQQDANIRFGFSAKQTLEIAQGLYEKKKCLSYPRTDSRVLGSKNVAMVQGLIQRLSKPYPDVFSGIDPQLTRAGNKRVFNDARLTDHHALIPLAPLPASSSDRESKIYDMVLKRFGAAFYPDWIYEVREILTEVDQSQVFHTMGRVTIRPGWQSLLTPGSGKKRVVAHEQPLPPLEKGDVGDVVNSEIEDKKTVPPPEYTEALLLKDMTNPGRYVGQADLKKIYRGDVGLGTQATRAQIIETLLARNYVRRAKKTLLATPKGMLLIDTLKKFRVAGTLASPEKTALWEMELGRISAGQGSVDRFLDDIEKFVRDAVREFLESNTVQVQREAVGRCPECGRDVVDGYKTFECSGKRKADGGCRFVIWKKIAGKRISAGAASMLLNGRAVGPYRGFVSKKKKRFSASLKLVRENGKWQVQFMFDNSGAKPSAGAQPAALDGAGAIRETAETPNDFGLCPVCGGKIIKGKRGYGCSNWRARDGGCQFVIWEMIGRKKLTPANIKTLTAGKITRKYVFREESGRKYRAKLKLAQGGDGIWQPVMVEKEAYYREGQN